MSRFGVAVVVSGWLLLGCSSSVPVAQETTTTSSHASGRRASSGMRASATIGGMNQEAVETTSRSALPEARGCLDEGRRRAPYLGGDVEIFLRVDRQGRAIVVLLPRSTLGDHDVEACILEALRNKQWPRPVGGEVGEIRQSFSFAAPDDQPVPRDWSGEALAQAWAAVDDGKAYGELLSKLNDCRSDAKLDRLGVTWYVDEDGMAGGFGVASDDENARSAIDCLATVVTTTSFPEPGREGAKVVVTLK